MWIVFCSSSDYSGIWAFEGLQRKGLAPLELVTSECLSGARLWEHRVGAGGAHLKIGLLDGRTICTSRIRGALNCIGAPPPGLIAHAVDSDRDYATAEMQAFYLTGSTHCPASSPTNCRRKCLRWMGSCLGMGHARRPLRLQSSAISPDRSRSAARGYASLAPEGSPVTSMIVLDGVGVFGPQVTENVTASCQALARMEKARLLGVDLYQDSAGDWLFAGATPTPGLPAGGEPLLDGDGSSD